LAVLPAWRETTFYSPLERSALALAEAVTLMAHDQVPGEVYEAAALHLSESQITAVCWLTIAMNAFNRVAIISRYPVGS
jgi:alkylhydroperoxidase family enzyme